MIITGPAQARSLPSEQYLAFVPPLTVMPADRVSHFDLPKSCKLFTGSAGGSPAPGAVRRADFAKHSTADVLLALRARGGRATRLSPELLTKLSEDPDREVRSRVAANPKTAPEVLDRMSTDDYFYVWEMVAGNPSTPPSTLEKLSHHKNWGVRMKVAGNSKAPPAVLAELAEDQEEWVLFYVAGIQTHQRLKDRRPPLPLFRKAMRDFWMIEHFSSLGKSGGKPAFLT